MPRCGNQRASRPQAELKPFYARGCGAPAQAPRLLHPPLPQHLDDQSYTLSHTFHAAASGAAAKQGTPLAAVRVGGAAEGLARPGNGGVAEREERRQLRRAAVGRFELGLRRQ